MISESISNRLGSSNLKHVELVRTFVKLTKAFVGKGHRMLTLHLVAGKPVLGGDQRTVSRVTRNQPLMEELLRMLDNSLEDDEDQEFEYLPSLCRRATRI